MKETLKETLKETQEDPREIQILNAAKNVFQKKGMDGARMQEIADEVGINKAKHHHGLIQIC